MNRIAEAERFATPLADTIPSSVKIREGARKDVVTATGAPSGAVIGARRGAAEYAAALEDLADR